MNLRVRFRNLIFDLDGTLVDSLSGIEASARHAAAQCLPERELPSMRELIGPPIAKMFETLWPDMSQDESKRLVACFRKHYDTEGCLRSQLYPGVPETLAELKANGAAMFVLTNKPRHASRVILEHLGVWSYFTELVSPDSHEPGFRVKAEGAKFLQHKYALKPGSTIVIGDGRDDLEAAEACGFSFLTAGFGYGSAAQGLNGRDLRVAKTFSSILSAVL